MKRREMIDIIVYEALSWDGLDTSGVPLSELANDILSVCEKYGMLPPSTNLPTFDRNDNAWEPDEPTD